MLSPYLIFHLNLMYSSIEEEQRENVIKSCYYPLLELAESIPLGIEISGLTLEIVDEINKDWVKRLRCLIRYGRVELVGSGYSQIIGPLMPKELNKKNQALGMEIYENVLGVRPSVALVNEMAYSRGLLDIYAEVGYRAIIMEWNNPYRFHREWRKEWMYFPCIARGVKYETPVIWVDSIAFQKFQRYAHGEISLKEYMDYLLGHINKKEGFFPVYASDAEVFNFRPGRYKTEVSVRVDEWRRIRKFLLVLARKGYEFVLPSQTLTKTLNVVLSLESSEQPIPVKKQEKYNINRWAVTGRDDLTINTCVYRIYERFLEDGASERDWKELLYFASSDFRTHITEKRWKCFRKKIDSRCRSVNVRSVFGSEQTDVGVVGIRESRFHLSVETRNMICVFNKTKGMTAKGVVFKDIYPEALIGTIPHGFYDDISLGADFFSFHSLIERPGEHKITNLFECNFKVKPSSGFVEVEDVQESRGFSFLKRVRIYDDKIGVYIRIFSPTRKLARIHPFNLTFIPDVWDKRSLFFATNNGGDMEFFSLESTEVNHFQSLSALISAKYGLGATEGVMVIGDRRKCVEVRHNPAKSALIPSVYFKPIEESFFLRIEYSACEMDDTFKENDYPYTVECEFLIYANRECRFKP